MQAGVKKINKTKTMTQKIDIEKVLYPNSNQLLLTDGIVHSIVVDAELDPISCVFNNDDAVEINTENLHYITLTRENLMTLLDLIEQAENYYKENI